MAAAATNGPIPQRKTFEFPGVQLSSEFCSGNMTRAEQMGEDLFWIWTANDCAGTEVATSLRTWFYFKVRAEPGKSLTFSVRNLNNQLKLYREGFRPVMKIGSEGEWNRIEGRYTYYSSGDGNLELTFTQDLDVDDYYYFATTFPWSYDDNDVLLTQLQEHIPEDIYFHRDCLAYSLERRCLDLVTISSF